MHAENKLRALNWRWKVQESEGRRAARRFIMDFYRCRFRNISGVLFTFSLLHCQARKPSLHRPSLSRLAKCPRPPASFHYESSSGFFSFSYLSLEFSSAVLSLSAGQSSCGIRIPPPMPLGCASDSRALTQVICTGWPRLHPFPHLQFQRHWK
ncbi:hypothetical protein F5887DRAFT_63522 [Amanita rubescens]|nr:hypothetical protein F5887DRAFT_63522 [Amanita rubescens]